MHCDGRRLFSVVLQVQYSWSTFTGAPEKMGPICGPLQLPLRQRRGSRRGDAAGVPGEAALSTV